LRARRSLRTLTLIEATNQIANGPPARRCRAPGAGSLLRRRAGAAPLGWAQDAGLTLWLLFPLFCALGYALCVVGARAGLLASLSFAVSCLLLLGLGAAAALVLAAAALLHPVGHTDLLWYVLVVAGVLGTIGAAARSAARLDTPAR